MSELNELSSYAWQVLTQWGLVTHLLCLAGVSHACRVKVVVKSAHGHIAAGLDITTVGLAAERDLFLRGLFNLRS